MIQRLLEICQDLEIEEQRRVTDHYGEIVIMSRQLPQWEARIGEILGPTAKPKGKNPTPEEQQMTAPYGGIFKNQTLYRHTLEQACWLAMIWPWQDGEHVTLKIARVELPSPA